MTCVRGLKIPAIRLTNCHWISLTSCTKNRRRVLLKSLMIIQSLSCAVSFSSKGSGAALKLSGWSDLNRQPLDYESSALTDVSYTPFIKSAVPILAIPPRVRGAHVHSRHRFCVRLPLT